MLQVGVVDPDPGARSLGVFDGTATLITPGWILTARHVWQQYAGFSEEGSTRRTTDGAAASRDAHFWSTPFGVGLDPHAPDHVLLGTTALALRGTSVDITCGHLVLPTGDAFPALVGPLPRNRWQEPIPGASAAWSEGHSSVTYEDYVAHCPSPMAARDGFGAPDLVFVRLARRAAPDVGVNVVPARPIFAARAGTVRDAWVNERFEIAGFGLDENGAVPGQRRRGLSLTVGVPVFTSGIPCNPSFECRTRVSTGEFRSWECEIRTGHGDNPPTEADAILIMLQSATPSGTWLRETATRRPSARTPRGHAWS